MYVASYLRMDCHGMMDGPKESKGFTFLNKKHIFLTSSTVKSRQANVSLKPPVTSTLGFTNKSRAARASKPTRARMLSTAFNHIDEV